MNAAHEAERVAVLLPAQITAAEQLLGAEMSDMAVIETAKAHLATVEADPGLRGSVQAGIEAVAEVEQRIVQLSAPAPQDAVPTPAP